ncbi:L-amino acid N-acyltransferase YncA [Haladaptatus litoreus]|uniref:L-amino acid N-acyltransferase YncA n=1 Tax=Haladaptatus litoreus TaxID=553468 RepID=A0A1N6ZY00_9EURY|nr:GNAT family N-acetyltransferase [Haladaptatus litoreus]SIR31636.1 L-amino acid N-acyltransferase YncA [Haladaptatus litoreus]
METRDVTASDIPEIRRVSHEAVNTAYDFLPEKEREATVRERFSDDRLETALADDDVILIAAVADGELVGYAHVDAINRADAVGEGSLRGIYVRPNRWREGIGTILLDATEKAIRERGFTQLSIGVLTENERGRRFFESNGFERVEERVEDLFTGGTAYQQVYYHDFA